MLLSLYIQNYAIISNLEIHFYTGFSTITGETGAGKSILMGALSLILGQRADTGILKDKSKKCIIESRFEITNYSLQSYFAEHALDYENTTIIRREISADGKSRAFINDTPVNLSILKEIGAHLVDIHSQHQNLSLSSSEYQLQIIDTYAGCADILAKYKTTFLEYKNIKQKLSDLVDKATKAKTDLDYYQFQFDQLNEANIFEEEQENLEKELAILTHVEEINSNLDKALFLFTEKENSILAQLKEAQTAIQNIVKYQEETSELQNRLESTVIELKDIINSLQKLVSNSENNPERIFTINDRLNIIYSLQKKHRVATCKELISIKDAFESQINEITSFDSEINKTKNLIEKFYVELLEQAKKLHKNRETAAPLIEKDIIGLLKQLGMPHAKLNIQINKLEDPTITGIDNVIFTFSANKNIETENISKVASGGELSRLMLSIKSLLAEYSHLPTIIFDEIDTGVSGDIADKMGEIMRKIAKQIQVISITHLPQIASKGEHHYMTYKTETKETTSTQIKLLTKEERITEIARMLSGSELTEAAISNAMELLSSGK